ncbi:hypothetical protein ACSBR1_009354 [Camellia fascicularis]
MFDFGDELIIGSQRIPWLIWIQLLVMLLLIILLYYFTIIALGLDPSPTSAAAPLSSALLVSNSGSSTLRPLPSAAAASSSRLHNSKLQVGEGHGIKGDTETSTSRRRVRREEIQEKEGSSSAKDTTHASVLEHSYHPCHYLGLAKQAFLKCLGLDPPSKDPSNTRHRKEQ